MEDTALDSVRIKCYGIKERQWKVVPITRMVGECAALAAMNQHLFLVVNCHTTTTCHSSSSRNLDMMQV